MTRLHRSIAPGRLGPAVVAMLLVALLAVSASPVRAQSDEGVSIARSGHTATLLPDGTVLLAGGSSDDGTAPSSAVRLDLATGEARPAGSLPAFWSHTATRLDDGRVLLIGVTEDGASVAHFDPASGRVDSWSPLAIEIDTWYGATRLADGRVLIIAAVSTDDPVPVAFLFDVAAGTVEAIGAMATPTQDHTATLLRDGTVLLAGGRDASRWRARSVATTERFEPRTRAFTPAAEMTVARRGHTATLLLDGRVLIAGGVDASPPRGHATTTAEVFDPLTGAFLPTGSMATARSGHTATLLDDGRVLIAGGQDAEGAPIAEIWDPVTGTFRVEPAVRTARGGHAATLLSDGRVLISGEHAPGGVSWPAELYDPVSRMSAPLGDVRSAMVLPTFGREATLLGDGRVLFTGGTVDDSDGTPLGGAEVYDPATGMFQAVGAMVSARNRHSATVLRDGRVLIAGGFGPEHRTVATAELFDPTTGMFVPTGRMTAARMDHTATRLRDGRVLIVGGDTRSAELFDPRTGRFSAISRSPAVRDGHTATLLRDGSVLLAGGSDRRGRAVATAELFDPRRGTFTAAGAMRRARADHSAARLPDGTVLIVGGADDGRILATVERLDPRAGTFVQAGRLRVARTHHTATLLHNGRVLIVGGGLPNAELHQPRSGRSVATDAPGLGRWSGSHTATRLRDGTVLVTAGPDITPVLYHPATGRFLSIAPATGCSAPEAC